MIKLKRPLLKLIYALPLSCHTILYALPTPITQVLVPSRYIFIENNVDHEFFIVGTALNPHFTGSNVWTKHKTDQDNLGHMGPAVAITPNTNVDMWLNGSTITQPFQGVRCRVNSTGRCPASGFIAPNYIDDKGFYKSRVTIGEDGGAYAFASFSSGFYAYLNSIPLNSTETLNLNVCTTPEEYDPKQGGRCQNATRGNWTSYRQSATKIGHIRLNDNKAFSEIWVASDGTPMLSGSSAHCENAMSTNGGATQRTGIACKMVGYNLRGNITDYHPNFYIRLKTNNTNLRFTPAAADLQIQAANGTWVNHNAANSVRNIMSSGDGNIKVLFTKAFFQRLLSNQGSANIKDTFIFEFDNRGVYAFSGLYGFSVTTTADILPREFSISIKPQDASQSALQGKIGQNEPSIKFKYIVTQSASQKADVITARVIAAKTNVRGLSYCLFKSNDSTISVPIPAYLSFTNSSLVDSEQYSGCDANNVVNISNAMWTQTPWDTTNSGYFYSTPLNLIFPMNNQVSEQTITGNDWMGSVHAEGEVKVDAKWIGVK